MNQPARGSVGLVLDEMFSPKIAEALQVRGFAVVAVAERAGLRATADDDLYAWAVAQSCWLLTENVKDFRPILLREPHAGGRIAAVLFSSNRTFPRSRHSLGQVIEALDTWLSKGPPAPPVNEDWFTAAAG